VPASADTSPQFHIETLMIRLIVLLLALAVPLPAWAQEAPPKPAAKAKQASPKAGAAKPAEPAANGSCIGVITHLGPFQVQHVSPIVFGNDLKEQPMPGLDDLVVARVRAAAGGRASVRKIAYASNAFVPFDGPDRPLFRNAEEDLTSVVRSIAKGSGCERYVVVVRGMSKFWNTNQLLKGVGVATFAEGRKTYLFALSYIRVYDGRSFAILKKGPGGGMPDLGNKLFGTGISGPARDLGTTTWPPAPEAIPGLRDGARSLLAQSLDKVLPGLLAP
jgi:hypothetical protein